MLDLAWVALSLLDHVGGKKLNALVSHFGSARAALTADPAALERVPGIGPKIARAISEVNLAGVMREVAEWQRAGVRLLPLNDPAYPACLRALEDAPPTLFVYGDWQPFRQAVAVVGTRQPSPAAAQTARSLGLELARRGYLVVSGLALGIDAAAHQGALDVTEGRTLAVLGSGVLRIYPARNQSLAAVIARRGALVSEVSPQAEPSAASLVARNRLISGLSTALIVVETQVDGGAMHAARRAREQGRAVYVVESAASGNRALLDSGARPLPTNGLPVAF